jgi:hypothetical protein
MRTGTLTSPKEIAPLQIGLMPWPIPVGGGVSTPADPAKGLLVRRADVLRKTSPPSGGVDSSGRFTGPKSFSGRGIRLWMLWRGDRRHRLESTESSAKLVTIHRGGPLTQA